MSVWMQAAADGSVAKDSAGNVACVYNSVQPDTVEVALDSAEYAAWFNSSASYAAAGWPSPTAAS